MTRAPVEAEPLRTVVDIFGTVRSTPSVDADTHESSRQIMTGATILTWITVTLTAFVNVLVTANTCTIKTFVCSLKCESRKRRVATVNSFIRLPHTNNASYVFLPSSECGNFDLVVMNTPLQITRSHSSTWQLSLIPPPPHRITDFRRWDHRVSSGSKNLVSRQRRPFADECAQTAHDGRQLFSTGRFVSATRQQTKRCLFFHNYATPRSRYRPSDCTRYTRGVALCNASRGVRHTVGEGGASVFQH
jgi:hypothetical protein